jgi:hypothetical protein
MNFMFNLEDYETVEERLVKYWKDHPDGRIDTTLVEHTLQRFIVKAAIYRTEVDGQAWTTGYAEETVSTRGVNSTSALENCETSAIGRALANAGYVTKGKRPSREEMAKVKAAEPKGFTEKLNDKIIMPVEDDVWTVKAVAPAASAAEAVALVQDVLGGTTIDKDIPRCSKCHDNKPMQWKTGVSAKGKAWGKFDCYVCRDVIWYNITKDGTWRPQEERS